MMTMKRDMTGAGVVLAVLGALADVDCPVRVTGLLPLAENSVGARRRSVPATCCGTTAGAPPRSPTPTPRAGWCSPTPSPTPSPSCARRRRRRRHPHRGDADRARPADRRVLRQRRRAGRDAADRLAGRRRAAVADAAGRGLRGAHRLQGGRRGQRRRLARGDHRRAVPAALHGRPALGTPGHRIRRRLARPTSSSTPRAPPASAPAPSCTGWSCASRSPACGAQPAGRPWSSGCPRPTAPAGVLPRRARGARPAEGNSHYLDLVLHAEPGFPGAATPSRRSPTRARSRSSAATRPRSPTRTRRDPPAG